MTQRHRPIPIAAARELAEKYGYDQVVILGADREQSKNHVATYGVTKEHCDEAAKTGEFIGRVLGPQDTESLRNLRSALNAEIQRRLVEEGVEPTDDEQPLEIETVELLKMEPPHGELRWLLSAVLRESGRKCWLPLSSAMLADLAAKAGGALMSEPKGPQGIVLPT